MEYIITRTETNNEEELMHFGVKGMKWGHRKNYYGSSGDKFKASNGVTVGAPKNAGVAAFRKVQGSKIGGAALNGFAKANTAIYGRGKNKSAYRKMEERSRKENQAVREANQAHKASKQERKAKIKNAYKDVQKNATFGQKLMYNDVTRKKAAKYVVDNNMSVKDATKKANKEAMRNTAVLLGAYGVVTIASLYR